MPDLTWTADVTGTYEGSSDSFDQTWARTGPRLLNALVQVSRSHCGIIRREDKNNSQELTLEGCAFGDIDPEMRDSFSIPETKSLRYWSGNAFESCYIRNYPNGSYEAFTGDSSTITEGEIRFLQAVRWRASFPLQIGEALPRLAILLSFSEEKPDWLSEEMIAFSWLAGQSIASLEFRNNSADDPHSVFVESARQLPVLSYMKSESDAFSALLRILVSGHGMGWHRIWLLKKSGDSLICQQCGGGSTYRDWANGASFVGSMFSSLLDEIAHDILAAPRRDDTLWETCLGREPLTVPASWFSKHQPKNGGEEWFLLPNELGENSTLWNEKLRAKASSANQEFDPCPSYSWCSISASCDEYVLVLGHWAHDRLHKRDLSIETGCLLAAASAILNWTRNDNADMEEDRSEPLIGLLSWLGLTPVSKQDFSAARARVIGLMFQTSGEFRRSVHEELKTHIFAKP